MREHTRSGHHFQPAQTATPPRVEPALAELRELFQAALNAAITQGSTPRGASGLGPRTVAAVTTLAVAHPDADVELITDAYDAFSREHG